MRVKITTTIEEGLLNHAKSLSKEENLEGVNAIIERALRTYFSRELPDAIWEKSLPSGWVKKVIVGDTEVLLENIKCRKVLKNHNQEDYTQDALKSRGWKRVSEK